MAAYASQCVVAPDWWSARRGCRQHGHGYESTPSWDAGASGQAHRGSFGGKQDLVLIKPNIGWDRVPAQAANTDPTVVAAVVRACREAGAREIWVLDCPVHDAETTYAKSGDATRVLMRNGPSGGDLGDVKRVDAVAVSVDPVAADAWAATLLEVSADRVGSLALGEQRGLGTADLGAVAPVEMQSG